MVQRMPGNAASPVTLRPAPFCERRALRRSLNGVSDGGAKFRGRAMVVPVRRREAKPELPHVGALGVAHVIGHFVAVATAAARTFAEFCRGGTKNLVVDIPGGLQQGRQPLALGGLKRR